MAFTVARCFNRRWWFAEKIVTWERQWLSEGAIPEGKPIREAVTYLEHGKDNYRTVAKMIKHTIKVVSPIFRHAFPGFQGLFAFDNSSNHGNFAMDMLVVLRMNGSPRGRQSKMRKDFIHRKGWPQQMVFSMNYHGKPTKKDPTRYELPL